MVNIYKFCKILIQPPGEPREQHLGDVRPKKFELHKKTGRVAILGVKNEMNQLETLKLL